MEAASVVPGCQRPTKDIALEAWRAVTRGIDDKVLAAEIGISRGHYSHVISGEKGDLIDLVYRLPPHRRELRAAFFLKLSESEEAHPLTVAGEAAVAAMTKFLTLCVAFGFPGRAEEDERRRA